jgi:hypothetical protein
LALALRRPRPALDLARKARAAAPTHPGPAELLTDVFLALDQPDSALAAARTAVVASPGNLLALDNYGRALDSTGAPAWRRQLAAARKDQALGRLVAATARLDSAGASVQQWSASRDDCWEAERSLPAMRLLRPGVASAAEAWVRQCREAGQ